MRLPLAPRRASHERDFRPDDFEYRCDAPPGDTAAADAHRWGAAAAVAAAGHRQPVHPVFGWGQEPGSADQAGHFLCYRPDGHGGDRSARAAFYGALGTAGLCDSSDLADRGGTLRLHGNGRDSLDQYSRGDSLPAIGDRSEEHTSEL